MKGTIKAYSTSVNAGVIKGEDGKTYGFAQSVWDGTKTPVAEQNVTFTGSHRTATQVSEKEK